MKMSKVAVWFEIPVTDLSLFFWGVMYGRLAHGVSCAKR